MYAKKKHCVANVHFFKCFKIDNTRRLCNSKKYLITEMEKTFPLNKEPCLFCEMIPQFVSFH